MFDSTAPSCDHPLWTGVLVRKASVHAWQVYQSINQPNNQSISQRIESIKCNPSTMYSCLIQQHQAVITPAWMGVLVRKANVHVHARQVYQSSNQPTNQPNQSISQRIESIIVIHHFLMFLFHSSKLWSPLREWGYLWWRPVHVHDRIQRRVLSAWR